MTANTKYSVLFKISHISNESPCIFSDKWSESQSDKSLANDASNVSVFIHVRSSPVKVMDMHLMNNNQHVAKIYRQVSNIRRALIGHKIVDHSLQLYLRSQLNTWLQWIGQRQLQDETRDIYVLWLGAPYIRDLTVCVASWQPGLVTKSYLSTRKLQKSLILAWRIL